MQRYFLFLVLTLFSAGLWAQLIITDPAAPTDDRAVTITFDATQGNAGLANCGCDIYLHTGVITNNSTSPSDWKYVQTTWGVANAAWRLTPVAGQPNKFTYTFGPSIREYFGVPAAEVIQRIAFVFRNADGTREGKASGNADIFVDVSAGGGALGITVVGDPGQATWPLGRPLPVLLGATREATLEIYDNAALVASTTGVELPADLVFTTSGLHNIRFVARTGDGQTAVDSFAITARLEAEFTQPSTGITNATAGSTVTLAGTSYLATDLSISDGTNTVFTGAASTFSQQVTLPNAAVTTYTLTSTYQGETATDQVTFVTGSPEVAEPPAGFRPGAVDLDNGDVLLQLRAPGKDDVFVIGNFNNWQPTAASRMKKSANDTTFWLTVSGLEPDEDLIYQYLIDGNIRQPDPFSTLVLDPNNDPFIEETTFAGIPDYPSTATTGILSWHLRSAPEYVWETNDYERPDPKKMVVYELLVRDFLEDHSFKSLQDTLDYLQRLGVNTIEFMPLNEFEGNISWGYNVSFHMALDKYYGSPNDLKALIDACHSRGMAVVLDVVYNHAFGQSSLARMWWDEANFRPTPENPYLNVTARHPFNVGYDFNHESPLTKEYLKVGIQYWIEEFRFDGFRFDLSKGFTQTNTGNDVGAWNRYDAGRIATLKDYADHIWSIDPETYVIMEHLAESREEEELAQYGNGMYFWSGFEPHNQYLEGSLGASSNFSQVLASNRGFSDRSLVAYMESHDEERMQYKNRQFGRSAGTYNIRNVNTGLDRVQLASTFFYPMPGPKMLWQFGELGYDFSINQCPNNGGINNGCRTDPKPIRWDYREEPARQQVYNWIADLLYLRNNYDFFHGTVVKQRLATPDKIVQLSGTDGEVAIVGNFGITPLSATGIWPSAGTWYDYETGETITVTDPNAALQLAPGEFHLYLSRPIARGGGNIGTSTNQAAVARLQLRVDPNPSNGPLRVSFHLERAGNVAIDVLDLSGRRLSRLYQGQLSAGNQSLPLRTDLPAGLYFLRVEDGVGSAVQKVVVQ
ncbi:alpha-amylase family glycosyl hydrolase [Neolewinella lacunae]|uniref:T9SS type A sorting domain-containing protein n=1 Tax=Neolewinella lacunae TaxID=1517758 RepID=A0A923T6Z2_9BACT|nr:alpha-amylase family glycosyl hydrolase [Neolewinella lacunae]MBC6993940.1 T9SS type A sorting domain-containing protein [Neolewinella lacunae]MDN3634979.1 alpha-amylase family glycosyl hydrolase [Neolewinella lacunae]